MEITEQSRFDKLYKRKLYKRHLRALKLQGLSDSTIDVYSRAVRRLADHDGQVTFRYTEGLTGETRTRTLPGEDFLWLVLQHVLPKGFRRVRDYGFLHGNAKPLLRLVQLVLHVLISAATPKPRPIVSCPSCRRPMQVAGVLPRPRARTG